MIPELLTKIKNKVKESPHLPYKSKEIMYHILKKVWTEYQEESLRVDCADAERRMDKKSLDDIDLPDFMKDIFRDRSKQ